MAKIRLSNRASARMRMTLATQYHYGYPAFGSVQPNVVAQWLFTEGSGNITDTVTSQVMTAEFGPMTYNQVVTGSYTQLSPGIYLPGSAVLFGDFKAGAPVASYALGTKDFVFECWLKPDNPGAVSHVYSDLSAAETKGWFFSHRHADDTQARLTLKADDTTIASVNWVISASTQTSTTPLKYRVTVSRNSAAELFINGVSQGTNDISAVSGKTISSYGPYIGSRSGGNDSLKGTLYELRLTIGNTTNNSGGPNGG